MNQKRQFRVVGRSLGLALRDACRGMLARVTCFNKKSCAVMNSLNVSSGASHYVKFGFKWAWLVTTSVRHFFII